MTYVIYNKASGLIEVAFLDKAFALPLLKIMGACFDLGLIDSGLATPGEYMQLANGTN